MGSSNVPATRQGQPAAHFSACRQLRRAAPALGGAARSRRNTLRKLSHFPYTHWASLFEHRCCTQGTSAGSGSLFIPACPETFGTRLD